ncbi:hypothetical protein ACIQVE_02175 [Pseudomonas sp. NPDC098747]|uniref:hypothetical protein n=1 Tax=Pseudomonas sp. NPDC098747 TaxID=3364487 RepID=UPI00383BE8B2
MIGLHGVAPLREPVVVSEHLQAPSAANLRARPGYLAATLNALLIKELSVFLFQDERFLERVNTRSLIFLAQVFIPKYLKTLLDNRSCSQYCSRRQEKLSWFQRKRAAPRKVHISDVI